MDNPNPFGPVDRQDASSDRALPKHRLAVVCVPVVPYYFREVAVLDLVAGSEIEREGLARGLGGPQLERARTELLVVLVDDDGDVVVVSGVVVAVVPVDVVFVAVPFVVLTMNSAAVAVVLVVVDALILAVVVADDLVVVLLAVSLVVVAIHRRWCRSHLVPRWQSHSAKWNEW